MGVFLHKKGSINQIKKFFFFSFFLIEKKKSVLMKILILTWSLTAVMNVKTVF